MTATLSLRSSTPTSTAIGVGHRGEERGKVRGMGVERRRDFAAVLSHFAEEVPDAPHEDPRVPQASLAHHHLGARHARLLDKLGDATGT